MTLRFSSTGVTAGTMNRFQVLRMPAAKATPDMHRMWETSSASSRWPPPCCCPKGLEASSHTSSGAPSTPSTEVASKAQSNTEATASINPAAQLRLLRL